METLKVSDKLKSLMLSGRKINLPKGQIIQSTDDRRVFNFIAKGYVKRYLISNDGSLGVQVLYGPEEVFPITLLFESLLGQQINDSPEIYYYQAMTNVGLYMLNEVEIIEKIEADPNLYKDLMIVAGMRLHSTLHGLENLTLKTSYYRVAHELLFIAQKYGKKNGDTVKIPFALTHQDLADILSLTRETVSVAMTQLAKKKILIGGKSIYINSLEALRTEAYS